MNKILSSFIILFLMISVLVPSRTLAATTDGALDEIRAKAVELRAQLLDFLKAGQPEVLPASVSGSGVSLSRALGVGSSDLATAGEVSKLQTFLKATGDFTFDSITGYYGPVTEEAVKKFQARKGIVSSGTAASTGYGFVGPRTRAALAEGYASSQNEGSGNPVDGWIKAMTFNMAGGNPTIYEELEPVVDRITNLIVAERPDVVGLQEVPVDHPAYPGDAVAMINQMLDDKGYPMQFRSLRYGGDLPNLRLMILSKSTIKDYEELQNVVQGHTNTRTVKSQTFRVDIGNKTYRAFNYHNCASSDPNTLLCIGPFVDDVESYLGEDEMTVLLGDFNLDSAASWAQEALNTIRENFRDSCTESSDSSCIDSTPGGSTDGHIDYIWLRKGTHEPYTEPWRVWAVRAATEIHVPEPTSDHHPIIGTFSFSVTEPDPISRRLTTVGAGLGSGRIVSSPTGINCGTDCSEDYSDGNNIVLTAIPDNGSTFTGWGGITCSGIGTCNATMDRDRVVVATFGVGVPVPPPPSDTSIEVTRPNGGETWSVGKSEIVRWRARGSIVLDQRETATISVIDSKTNTETVLASGVENDGAHTIVIASPIDQARIRVKVTTSGGFDMDESDRSFIVKKATDSCPEVTVEFFQIPPGCTKVPVYDDKKCIIDYVLECTGETQGPTVIKYESTSTIIESNKSTEETKATADLVNALTTLIELFSK